MAIRGSLKEASLPDVLQLLSMGKKTGCLSVTYRQNFGYIYFNKGRICYASIVNRRDRLGEVLVKTGVITQAQLEEAVASQERRRDKRLGELLVEVGALTQQQLHDAIHVQIQEAVYFLFTWNQGTFNFEADVSPEPHEYVVSINPESLLLEGARRVDEWGLIEKKIPSFDIVFEVDRSRFPLPDDAGLNDDTHAVLALVDGDRDVQRIVDDSGVVEFEVGKVLYGLLNAGLIHRIGKTAAPATPGLSESRVEEHRNLGIAFYKTAMLDEAIREFRRVLELRAGDPVASFYVGLVLARQGKWAESLAAFTDVASQPNAGAAAFHNLAYALEQLNRYDEALAALDEATRRGPADARVQTSRGVLALLTGDLQGADTALTAARPLFGKHTPTAAWFHYLGLTAALLGDAPRAAAILHEGVAAHPHSAVLLNNLAAVLERAGDHEGAQAVADRGIQEDPGVAQLHKNLGDLHYRATRYDDALEAYVRAARLDPELGADLYLRLGNLRLRRQEREEAVRCWQRALELDPDNAIVRTNLESVRQVFS